jgi:SAM-dependent methyltransferase
MTITTPTPTEAAEAMAERVFGAVVESMYLASIHIGRELGLYAALRDHGPQTPADLAELTSTDERYVREWLEHQAVGGFLTYEDDTFTLPTGHAEALLDHESPYSVGPFAQMAVGSIEPVREVIEAFRTGGGVDYDSYPNGRLGQAEANRGLFVHDLGSSWIPALPGVHNAFREHGGRVADIACGSGWSSIEIARAYPKVRVDGFDFDRESIEIAEENLRGSGVESQVRFHCENGAAADASEGYDLVTIFEALHDMANPVEVLANARSLLAPDGVVLVMDEKAAHEFHAPADQNEQLYYGFSVLWCLPLSRAEDPSAATGTAMRPHTMQGYAEAAGYGSFEVLDIDNDLFRFYLLRP